MKAMKKAMKTATPKAMKAMKKKDIIQSKHVDHIENERKILEMMQHPFIVSYQLFALSYDLFFTYR